MTASPQESAFRTPAEPQEVRRFRLDPVAYRALYVTRSLDGYADVRATAERWKPTEVVEGRAGRAFDRAHNRMQGSRDARVGTTLETDPSLLEELARVRGAAADRGAGVGVAVLPSASARHARKTLLLWVLLVVMFLAIWQVLQPSQPAPSRGRATAPTSTL